VVEALHSKKKAQNLVRIRCVGKEPSGSYNAEENHCLAGATNLAVQSKVTTLNEILKHNQPITLIAKYEGARRR